MSDDSSSCQISKEKTKTLLFPTSPTPPTLSKKSKIPPTVTSSKGNTGSLVITKINSQFCERDGERLETDQLGLDQFEQVFQAETDPDGTCLCRICLSNQEEFRRLRRMVYEERPVLVKQVEVNEENEYMYVDDGIDGSADCVVLGVGYEKWIYLI